MRTVTLQDLCVEVIVSNFKWYCKVYCSTGDSCLKLKFEFLKKKFSLLILQKLKERGRIEPECLDFLINKYLKVLDAEWLRPWPWETVCHRLAEIGTNIEKVNFAAMLGSWEPVMCYLPNLKNVIYHTSCSDEFLMCLSKFCKYVETLDVMRSWSVSDKGLMYLCCKDDKNLHSFHLPIKELLVLYVGVTDEGIAYMLRNMPSLEKINHHKLPKILYSMHKSDINSLNKLKPYNLTYMNLMHIDRNTDIFTDVFTVCIFVCPHLKFLACPILQKHHLHLCSQLKELENLELDCWKEVPLELNELLTLNGEKLISLKIYNFCLSLSILAQNCPQLNSLEMNGVHLQHNIDDYVPVFYNLEIVVIKKFILIEPVITQAVTCLLSSAPNLKNLAFESCALVSSDIKTQILRCCEQCKLRTVTFIDSGIELLKNILLTSSTLRILFLERSDKMYNKELIQELLNIAYSLPNRPTICVDNRHGIYDDDDGVIMYSDEEICEYFSGV